VSYNFLPYAQDQQYLLPPSLHEWVEEDSLERFISDVVDHLDEAGELAAFYAPYRTDGWGHPAYPPVMLLKVLLYGYAVGVRSSRKLAAALKRDVAFRYLAANLQPDFRTISDFRKRHLKDFEALFGRTVELSREAGLAKVGRVAIDGRRVKGNASLDRNRTREQIAKEVRAILEEAERLDREEDEMYGDRRGDELPEELRTREGRLQKLKEARARLEAEEEALKEEQAAKIEEREREERETGRKKRGRKPTPPDEVKLDANRKVNLTDPESRILKTRKGWVQGYNGQIMVDCTSQVILAQHVTSEENDVRQLSPLLDGCAQVNGVRPRELLADAGYWSEENVEKEAGEHTELFIATTKDWKRRKELLEQGPPRGRIPKHYGRKERMERKLCTKRGRETYRERSSTVEPVFGQMVMRGLGDFLLRGIEGAGGEWSLFSGTHNLLKLWRAGWSPGRKTRAPDFEPLPA